MVYTEAMQREWAKMLKYTVENAWCFIILLKKKQQNTWINAHKNPQFYLIWSFERTKTHLCTTAHSRIKCKHIAIFIRAFFCRFRHLRRSRRRCRHRRSFIFFLFVCSSMRRKLIFFSPGHCMKLWRVTVWNLHGKKSKGNHKELHKKKHFLKSQMRA